MFSYVLPPHLIAQTPDPHRDQCRLMVINRQTESISHCRFDEIGDFCQNMHLVVNNTRVMKARFWGKKSSGARIEILLVNQTEKTTTTEDWEMVVRPRKRLAIGTIIEIIPHQFTVTIRDLLPAGTVIGTLSGDDIPKLRNQFGRIPFPPYIESSRQGADTEILGTHYQTVYATAEGAVAAPTAGLHFTPRLFQNLESRGITRSELTLHVGLGTFQPIKDIETHVMHTEPFMISKPVADYVTTQILSGRVLAVGTTVIRALESAWDGTRLIAGEQSTQLFIRPGYPFSTASALVTNFHLPGSTLLLLVEAFMGRKLLERAYATAIDRGYRFYSFGDAMLIL